MCIWHWYWHHIYKQEHVWIYLKHENKCPLLQVKSKFEVIVIIHEVSQFVKRIALLPFMIVGFFKKAEHELTHTAFLMWVNSRRCIFQHELIHVGWEWEKTNERIAILICQGGYAASKALYTHRKYPTNKINKWYILCSN